MLATESWPAWDPEMVKRDVVTLVVQVNGKVRDKFEVAADISEDAAVELALGSQRVQSFLGDVPPRKVIAKPPHIVNLVAG